MSGIYIRGMEMPDSCFRCPFLDYEEGFCRADAIKHDGGWYENKFRPGWKIDGRPERCPLIPVPDHGRLIDVDELFDFIFNSYKNAQGDARKAYRDVLDAIVAAGDVIEAEEETE